MYYYFVILQLLLSLGKHCFCRLLNNMINIYFLWISFLLDWKWPFFFQSLGPHTVCGVVTLCSSGAGGSSAIGRAALRVHQSATGSSHVTVICDRVSVCVCVCMCVRFCCTATLRRSLCALTPQDGALNERLHGVGFSLNTQEEESSVNFQGKTVLDQCVVVCSVCASFIVVHEADFLSVATQPSGWLNLG